MAIKLNSTKKDRVSNFKVGVFGQSGAGKTSLAKSLVPDWREDQILYINVENGGEVLRSHDFASIDFEDIEGNSPIAKMREVIKYLRSEEGLNGFKDGWIVLDSFTAICEQIKAYLESKKDLAKYPDYKETEYPELWSEKTGNWNGMACYGIMKTVYEGIMDAFLKIPNCNKLVIFGAQERGEEGEKTMQLMIPGSFSDSAMFRFDEFYGIKVDRDEGTIKRHLVTNSDGFYIAKSRMSGGSGDILDIYEPAHLGNVIKKCYEARKEKPKSDLEDNMMESA